MVVLKSTNILNEQTNKGELLVSIILALVLGRLTEIIDRDKKLPTVRLEIAHGDIAKKVVTVVLSINGVNRFGGAKLKDPNNLNSVQIALGNAMLVALEKDLQHLISNKASLEKYKQELSAKEICLRFNEAICL